MKGIKSDRYERNAIRGYMGALEEILEKKLTNGIYKNVLGYMADAFKAYTDTVKVDVPELKASTPFLLEAAGEIKKRCKESDFCEFCGFSIEKEDGTYCRLLEPRDWEV